MTDEPQKPGLAVHKVEVGLPDGSWLNVGQIRDAILHTEVIETEQGDLIAGPDQVWLIPKGEQRSIAWEVSVTEEQFWLIVGAVYGMDVVREMKQELDDMLRWEGEGGSCTVD